MDVRILIVWQPTNLYQVCIFAPALARGWVKTYYSKKDCLSELHAMDLLTCAELDEALASDFDIKDRILVFHSGTNPQILQVAGFSENHPEAIN